MTSRCASSAQALAKAIYLAALACISLPLHGQYTGQPPSRIDVYAGYSYFTRQTDTVQGYRFPTMPYGALGQGAYYFKRSIGVEAGGSYQLTYKNDSLYFLQGGPIFRYNAKDSGLSVFAHGLVGTANISGPNIVATASPLTYSYYNSATWGQAYGAGFGMDYSTPFFNHHMAIRFIQADYEVVRVNYGTVTTTSGGNVSFDALRLSAGLVWHFGGVEKHETESQPGMPPPTGPQLSCSATPTTVAVGDLINVTAFVSGFDPRYSIAYAWSSTGGRLSGTDNTITIDTHGLAQGIYTTNVHASSGKHAADCSTTFTVASPQPPTISCTAVPNIVTAGQTVIITAQAYSSSNLPLTYSFKTSGGMVSGAGTSATLNTQGLPTGPVTVTCDTVDNLGRTAEATASFMVNGITPQPPPEQAIHTEPLCDISFSRDRARPTRVDNEAKACLDSVALSLQRSPDAQIVIVGDAAPSELGGNLVAAQRAVNTKAYLVNEKGIDPTRIEVRTGGFGGKVVQSFLVPVGADFDTDYSGSIPVSAAIQPQRRVPLKTTHSNRRRATATRHRRNPVHKATKTASANSIPSSGQNTPQQ